MAKAMARADSVLPFHEMVTISPSRRGGTGGAIKIGRPLSKRADSSVLMCGLVGVEPGRPTTVTSNIRPRLPTKESPTGWRASQA